MTWEIAVGLFTILSALCGVMRVVVRVNRTLTTLDLSVKRLNECIADQAAKNEKLFSQLERCDRRLHELERGPEREGAGTPRAAHRPALRFELPREDVRGGERI